MWLFWTCWLDLHRCCWSCRCAELALCVDQSRGNEETGEKQHKEIWRKEWQWRDEMINADQHPQPSFQGQSSRRFLNCPCSTQVWPSGLINEHLAWDPPSSISLSAVLGWPQVLFCEICKTVEEKWQLLPTGWCWPLHTDGSWQGLPFSPDAQYTVTAHTFTLLCTLCEKVN